jgi:hypothetical protein
VRARTESEGKIHLWGKYKEKYFKAAARSRLVLSHSMSAAQPLSSQSTTGHYRELLHSAAAENIRGGVYETRDDLGRK